MQGACLTHSHALLSSQELSGIVAILFCGFGMDIYTFTNLSGKPLTPQLCVRVRTGGV